MIVEAQIYVANMSADKVKALSLLTYDDIKSMTGFEPANGPHWEPCRREDCLMVWPLAVDEAAPNFEGAAFVREDFVEAVLDIVADVK